MTLKTDLQHLVSLQIYVIHNSMKKQKNLNLIDYEEEWNNIEGTKAHLLPKLRQNIQQRKYLSLFLKSSSTRILLTIIPGDA